MSTFKRHNLEEVLNAMKRNGLRVSTIIDVGIAYGTPGLYGTIDAVQYHLIEPLKEYLGTIQDLCKKYPATYTLAAAGEQKGTLTFNVHPDMSGSSFLSESEGKHVDGTPRTVPVTTIDDEVRQHALKGPFLIKVDVQGFELQVLNGAQKTLAQTEAIILEVSLFSFYQQSPLFADVIAYMAARGFAPYDIFGATYRPLDDALGQIDIAFVKNTSQLRQSQHFASQEQRKAMTLERMKHLNPR
ncbi:MAG: hypothetical protein A2Y14_03485 [Verrucomicrobia bacterium GWF2_51_19]|nr:MAG: hypothetical protein A2Y14_03485 [Verrucomicrobia bacterium GWF2_51_19]HCJ12105.1 FkbM family methyltransferase [Opitutae bacterium]